MTSVESTSKILDIPDEERDGNEPEVTGSYVEEAVDSLRQEGTKNFVIVC